MRALSNLADRLTLLRIVLTRRFIWPELSEVMQKRYYPVRDVRASAQPLSFAARLPRTDRPAPDFAAAIGPLAAFAPAGTPDWASEAAVSECLGELAFRLGAAKVIEVGCFTGTTSAHLALGLRAAGGGGRLWCVDGDQAFLDVARANLGRLGLADAVEFICSHSTDAALVSKLPAEADLIFLDTSHEYAETARELALFLPLLKRGGYLAMHDSIKFQGVRRCVNELATRFEVLTFATQYGNGLSLLWAKD